MTYKLHTGIDFIGVGAQKAGTTTLYNALSIHKEIFLPRRKETHFFDNPGFYSKGIDWYYSEHFAEASSHHTVGEFTPVYMLLPEIPERIAKNLGTGVKLVFSLRDPVKRAFSHYLHNVSNGRENRSFKEALNAERDITAIPYPKNCHYAYMQRGKYYTQIKRFLDYFPKKQCFFVLFEEDIANTESDVFTNLYKFLGVTPLAEAIVPHSNPTIIPRNRMLHRLVSNQKVRNAASIFLPYKARTQLRSYLIRKNKTVTKVTLSDNLRSELYNKHFREEQKLLEQIIGRSLSVWDPESINGLD